MYKVLTPHGFSEGERPVSLVPTVKTASEAQEFLRSLSPTKEHFYVLVIALGAGEYWGANRNGDYFPEAELVKTYKTFESGHVFRLHENDDPSKAIGKVLKAFWNDKMKRVELVLAVDREKGKDILERLSRGEAVDVSMGCKVEYDICSICGNKAKSRAEYCEHLRYHMNQVLPDGRQVYAINPDPVFFDISFVRKGADPTAKVLEKVASLKSSTIEKTVPGKAVIPKSDSSFVEALEEKFFGLPELPDPLLKALSHFFLGDVLSTLTLCNVQLFPSELEKLIGPAVFFEAKDLFRAMLGTPKKEILVIVLPFLEKKALHLAPHLPARTEKLAGIDSVLYRIYQDAMWVNMVKAAIDKEAQKELESSPWHGPLWFVVLRLIRDAIFGRLRGSTPTQMAYLKAELARGRIPATITPHYKFAETSTFLVPGYWFGLAEKLQKEVRRYG